MEIFKKRGMLSFFLKQEQRESFQNGMKIVIDNY